jgi:hypothetical protein
LRHAFSIPDCYAPVKGDRLVLPPRAALPSPAADRGAGCRGGHQDRERLV